MPALRKSRTSRPEQALQMAVAEYLGRTLDPSVVWSAIGHGGGGRTRGAILKGMGVKAGLPDIMIWWIGDETRCVGVELKSRRGGLSERQREMFRRLHAAGVATYTCRSVDDIQAIVRDLLIPSRDRYAKQARAA